MEEENQQEKQPTEKPITEQTKPVKRKKVTETAKAKKKKNNDQVLSGCSITSYSVSGNSHVKSLCAAL